MGLANLQEFRQSFKDGMNEATDGYEPQVPFGAKTQEHPDWKYLKQDVHDIAADKLEDLDDPRAAVIRARYKGEGPTPRYKAAEAAGSLFPSHQGTHILPDRTMLQLARYDGPHGVHWGVGLHPGIGLLPAYETHMPDKDFKSWVRKFGDRVRDIAKSVKPVDLLGEKKGRTLRLARERMPGPAAGIRDANSANHEKRAEIAKQILSEAGITPAVVRAALHHEGEQAQAAVVQVIRQRVDPAKVRFAAAWYGLVTNSPAVTVFHPTASGEDTLHVINSPHPSDHVAAYLRRADVGKFTTESHGSGTRAYIYDAGSQLPAADFARGLDASHSKFSGVGYRLGGGPGAGAAAGAGKTAGRPESRASYRDTIRDFESAAGR